MPCALMPCALYLATGDWIQLGDNEMKLLRRDIEINLWLLLLLAAVVAILIYRIGFHLPVPAFDQEALRNLLAR